MPDKRDTVTIFRERLTELIARSGQSHAAFAADAGLDRSTLSQLLAPALVRLPRAETVARIAARNHVSVDWLLGLSQRDSISTDIVSHIQIEVGARSHADERLRRWHEEAAGYKIRYVPASLPDLLKTEAVIDYEFRNWTRTSPQVRLEEAAQKLAYSRKPETDIEVCSSYQGLEGFARGEGVWQSLEPEHRREQLERMRELIDELYPTFRWFLYDGRQNYSAAYTIFGPLRAAVYVGDMYFVFNSTEHIRALTRHFDSLIREAVVQPHECGGFVSRLLDGLA